MIDVVICDDHAVLRRGIRDTLAEATDIRVRAEAGGYTELREVLRNTAGALVSRTDEREAHQVGRAAGPVAAPAAIGDSERVALPTATVGPGPPRVPGLWMPMTSPGP